MRIVTVEDNEDIAYFMQRAFDAQRFTQYEAMNPDIWADVDVAVIDHRMPDHTGCDVAEVARAAKPTVRLVLYTAYIWEVDIKCRNRFDVVIQKPCSFERLEAAVNG